MRLRQRRGTSLIETVVALLMLSIVAAALTTSTGAALRHEVDAGRRERAAELAADGLERLRSEPDEALRPRHEIETLTYGAEAFSRERRVEPTTSPGLWRLTVVARSSRGGHPVTLATLRRTAWSVP
jgi:Tfp pilus assembly protein PilV